jgi:3-hydroxyisobutyrate dehydrogenase-like beta-hydroxyacid dehydrogenase
MTTIGLLGTGDMGAAVGRALGGHGHRLVTSLAGRSERSYALAVAASIEDAGDLAALMRQSELVLSILPPAAALEAAAQAATAMASPLPTYVDCNAVSPATATKIAALLQAVDAPFIDGSIIGAAPGKGVPPRFFVSGADTSAMQALDGQGIDVRALGSAPGQASALKMCYAGLTKGTFTLHTAVLLAAHRLGLESELRSELEYSQAKVLERMTAIVPWLAADAGRWIGEMEEIAETFAGVGLTPDFHRAAAQVFALLDATPLAAETRESRAAERRLEDAIAIYAKALDEPDAPGT